MSALPSASNVVLLVLLAYIFFSSRGGFLLSLLHVSVAFALAVAARALINMRRVTAPDDSVILHSLAPSHFCEKTRWQLQRLGVRYREKCTLGISFMLTGYSLPTVRFPTGWSGSYISDSSHIARYLWGLYSTEPHALWLKPTPETLELEKLADGAGKAMQRYLYYYLLAYEDGKYLDVARFAWGSNEPMVPAWQRLIQPLVAPIQRQVLIVAFRLRSPRAPVASLEIIKNAFATVEERLADGRRFLCGSELTHADISVCAIFGLVLFLDEYGAPKGSQVKLAAMPKEARDELAKLQHSKAAHWVRRVYKEERHKNKQ